MTQFSSPEWQARTKRTVILFGIFFFIILLWFLRDILPLVIVSILLAFVLNPITTFITRRIFLAKENDGFRRGLASVIAFIIAILALTILFLVIVPVIAEEAASFGSRIPTLVSEAETGLENFLSQPILIGEDPFTIDGEVFIALDRIEEATGSRDLSRILQLDSLNLEAAAQTFISSVQNLSGPAFSFVGGAFNTVINAIFLTMMTFYLLKDGDNFIRVIVELVPDDYQADANRLLEALGNVWAAYVRGQLILCFVMGVSVYLVASLLGLPNALILGVLAGVLEFIPTLGPLIALIPAAFLALFSTSTTFPALEGVVFSLVVIFVWTMLQNIEAIVLVPRIMGDSLNLHPFVVMIGLLAGAALGGALGVILAAPFVASSRVIARYAYGKITDTNPFHEIDEEAAKPRDTMFTKLFAGLWSLAKEGVNRLLKKKQAPEKISDAE